MSTAESDLLRAGIAAAKAGRRDDGRNLLIKVVQLDQDNEAAWLWLAGLVDRPIESLVCLEHALRLNPGNEEARLAAYYLRQQLAGEAPHLPALDPRGPNKRGQENAPPANTIHTNRLSNIDLQAPTDVVEGVIRQPTDQIKSPPAVKITEPDIIETIKPVKEDEPYEGVIRQTVAQVKTTAPLNAVEPQISETIKIAEEEMPGEELKWLDNTIQTRETVPPPEIKEEIADQIPSLENTPPIGSTFSARLLKRSIQEREIPAENTTIEEKPDDTTSREAITDVQENGNAPSQYGDDNKWESGNTRTYSAWNNKRTTPPVLIGLSESEERPIENTALALTTPPNDGEELEENNFAGGTSALALTRPPESTDLFVADMRVRSGMRAPEGVYRMLARERELAGETPKRRSEMIPAIATGVMIVVFVISAAGIAYYFYNRLIDRQRAGTTPVGAQAINADLQQYKDSSFLMKYPIGWTAKPDTKAFPQGGQDITRPVVIFKQDPSESTTIEVVNFTFTETLPHTIDDPVFLDFQNRTVAASGNFKDSRITATEVISPTRFYIKGLPVLRIEVRGLFQNIPFHWSTIYILSGDHTMYFIEYTDTADHYDGFQPTLEQMLESFTPL